MRTIQAGCFNRSCTLRDAKFFWCRCNEQDSQYRRNQATLNIQVVRVSSLKRRAKDIGNCWAVVAVTQVPLCGAWPRLSSRATSESLSWLASGHRSAINWGAGQEADNLQGDSKPVVPGDGGEAFVCSLLPPFPWIDLQAFAHGRRQTLTFTSASSVPKKSHFFHHN